MAASAMGGQEGAPPAYESGVEGDCSATAQALKHNPGIAVEWSADDQAILEEGLSLYASETNIIRYAKVALQLPDKTVRDVALRCRWMNKKENGKRRKEDLRKNIKKEKATDLSPRLSSHSSGRSNIPPGSLHRHPGFDDDKNIYQGIGGQAGQLFEQNALYFNQISANLSSLQIQDNFTLLYQARDNIHNILNNVNELPEVMRLMPPFPEKIDNELADLVLSHMPMPMSMRMPLPMPMPMPMPKQF